MILFNHLIRHLLIEQTRELIKEISKDIKKSGTFKSEGEDEVSHVTDMVVKTHASIETTSIRTSKII
jgi:hypothetical protein